MAQSFYGKFPFSPCVRRYNMAVIKKFEGFHKVYITVENSHLTPVLGGEIRE